MYSTYVLFLVRGEPDSGEARPKTGIGGLRAFLREAPPESVEGWRLL
jgi:hypothetical protein